MSSARFRSVATAPLALAAALLGSPDGAAAQEPLPLDPASAARLSPALRRAWPDLVASDRVPVVVRFRADGAVRPDGAAGHPVDVLRRRARPAMTALASIVAAGDPDLVVRDSLWVVPAAVAEATPAALARLASSPDVERIWLDQPLEVVLPPRGVLFAEPAFTSDAMRTIGADAVWPSGATGRGVTVAFFDSGVDVGNAMLSSRWRGRTGEARAAWFDPFRRSSEPQDLIGHGTQVAVAAVGALPAGDTLRLPDGGTLVAATATDVVTGPAPEAEWIAARVFDVLGSGVYTRRSVLLQAFQWALDPDGAPATDDAPDVINNSWGIYPGSSDFDPCADLIYEAVDAVEAAGIAVLFATGNAGPTAGSVAPPAARDDPGLRSFAVGATQGVETLSVADYSGRGPSPCGGGIKPEVVAPGTVPEIRASGPRSARLTGFTVQGTSFAVAQASGTIALMRQVRPGATPGSLKRILRDEARDIAGPGPDNDAGWGVIDVPAAVSRARASVASPILQLASAWAEEDVVAIRIRNRGAAAWPGGTVRVAARGAGLRAEGPLPELGPFTAVVVELPLAVAGAGPVALEVEAADAAGSPALSALVLVAPPDLFGGFVLVAGDLRAGGNDFGRIGQVAAADGFSWQGTDLLPAGGLGVAVSDRISDAFYVTTLGRHDLKTRRPAIDTDWAPQRTATVVDPASAQVRFDDFEALAPVGVEVRASLAASDSGGVGALAITARIRNRSGATRSDLRAALLADWDLPGGESLRWAPSLRAVVAEPAEGGPIAVLAGEDVAAAVGAEVPLGTPGVGGSYEPESGVLWESLSEDVKLALVRGGSGAGLPGAATATDRAALLALGPFTLANGEETVVRFWLLAASDEESAAVRLQELRAEPVEPPDGGGETFRVEAPFPNPLRVGEGAITFPYEIPESEVAAGSRLTLEIYDLAGRRLYRRGEPISTAGSRPVFNWDGRLEDGGPAAAGVYHFVMRWNGETRSGRIMLLR
ncbi:MAG: S8 family serine peptidase [Gemmatimonadota bacterium]